MSAPSQPARGGGCFSKLLLLLLLGAAAGLGVALYEVCLPQDLSDLAGAPPVQPQDRDVMQKLKNAIDRSYPVTLSEASINQWLDRTLAARQGGFLSDQIKLKHVWLRLEEGRAELVMVREILGKPMTVSMYLRAEKMEDVQGAFLSIQPDGGPFHPNFPKPPRGGRFGRLVVPQGFLYLLKPAYQNLAAQFAEEGKLLTRMSKLTIGKGKLVLDPREMQGELGMPSSF